MKKKLLTILLLPLLSNAFVDPHKQFPVSDFNEVLLVEACCENSASCCVDFSESKNVNDFRDRVKKVDLYHDSVFRSNMRTLKIQERLEQTQRNYQNRFNEIGERNYQNRFNEIGERNYNNRNWQYQ